MKIAFFTGYRNIAYFKTFFKRFADVQTTYFYEANTTNISKDECSLKIEKNEGYEFLCKQNYDFVIVYGWNYIFPHPIIDKIEFYNIHPSLLPKYRGPLPLVFQLLNNEIVGGVTLHKIDENIDSGDVYKQCEYDIDKNASHISLNVKIMRCINFILNNFIKDYTNHQVTFTKQNDDESTYFTYDDLDKYILNNDCTYNDFCRIVKAFNGIPVKIEIAQNIKILKAYSPEKVANDYMEYKLLDKNIFIKY